MRRTLDWTDEEAFRAQLAPDFRPLVDLWDATFSMPYHRFRHEVREIARDNLEHVEGARCAAWDEIPQGALVLPVDDDDWFAPDVARTVQERVAATGADGVRWRLRFLQVDIDIDHTLSRIGRSLMPGVGPKWICTTNNYALVKRADNRKLLESHVSASRALTAREIDLAHVDRDLSLMNRSLASQTSLRRHRRPADRAVLLRKHRRYRRLYARAPQDWARPYVERMAELMRRLDVVA